MPTDPRDNGWTIPTTDADGYSDLIQFNGVHATGFRIPPLEATTTEIWFEESIDNDTDNCQEMFYDDADGTSTRVKLTVPTGKVAVGWHAKVDPGKFGGLNWVRIQCTDGTDGVAQTTERSITVAGRDYR